MPPHYPPAPESARSWLYVPLLFAGANLLTSAEARAWLSVGGRDWASVVRHLQTYRAPIQPTMLASQIYASIDATTRQPELVREAADRVLTMPNSHGGIGLPDCVRVVCEQRIPYAQDTVQDVLLQAWRWSADDFNVVLDELTLRMSQAIARGSALRPAPLPARQPLGAFRANEGVRCACTRRSFLDQGGVRCAREGDENGVVRYSCPSCTSVYLQGTETHAVQGGLPNPPTWWVPVCSACGSPEVFQVLVQADTATGMIVCTAEHGCPPRCLSTVRPIFREVSPRRHLSRSRSPRAAPAPNAGTVPLVADTRPSAVVVGQPAVSAVPSAAPSAAPARGNAPASVGPDAQRRRLPRAPRALARYRAAQGRRGEPTPAAVQPSAPLRSRFSRARIRRRAARGASEPGADPVAVPGISAARAPGDTSRGRPAQSSGSVEAQAVAAVPSPRLGGELPSAEAEGSRTVGAAGQGQRAVADGSSGGAGVHSSRDTAVADSSAGVPWHCAQAAAGHPPQEERGAGQEPSELPAGSTAPGPGIGAGHSPAPPRGAASSAATESGRPVAATAVCGADAAAVRGTAVAPPFPTANAPESAPHRGFREVAGPPPSLPLGAASVAPPELTGFPAARSPSPAPDPGARRDRVQAALGFGATTHALPQLASGPAPPTAPPPGSTADGGQLEARAPRAAQEAPPADAPVARSPAEPGVLADLPALDQAQLATVRASRTPRTLRVLGVPIAPGPGRSATRRLRPGGPGDPDGSGDPGDDPGDDPVDGTGPESSSPFDLPGDSRPQGAAARDAAPWHLFDAVDVPATFRIRVGTLRVIPTALRGPVRAVLHWSLEAIAKSREFGPEAEA